MQSPGNLAEHRDGGIDCAALHLTQHTLGYARQFRQTVNAQFLGFADAVDIFAYCQLNIHDRSSVILSVFDNILPFLVISVKNRMKKYRLRAVLFIIDRLDALPLGAAGHIGDFNALCLQLIADAVSLGKVLCLLGVGALTD